MNDLERDLARACEFVIDGPFTAIDKPEITANLEALIPGSIDEVVIDVEAQSVTVKNGLKVARWARVKLPSTGCNKYAE